ncbi:MAG: sigma-70 family RNA polymerase sigma factor [Clostridiales bacterium]|nr:sigma-70 family RNA polymerase sigma factor [Clostridiales bacterium]
MYNIPNIQAFFVVQKKWSEEGAAHMSEVQIRVEFEDFYRENYRKVLMYLCKHGMRTDDAADMTHDIFVYCWNKWDSYDPSKSAPSTWLFMIVRCRFKNYLRGRRESVDIDELSGVLADENATDMDRAMYLTQLREELAVALEQLPEVPRQIVILRYFKNLSWEETALRVGVSQGNARVILSRTLKKLEALLQTA